jgi:processing peptidase subunit alpha
MMLKASLRAPAPKTVTGVNSTKSKASVTTKRQFSTNVFPPLSREPEGFPQVKDYVSQAPKLKVSKTSQGTKVITVNDNSGVTSLGVFVNAGSRFEDTHNSGVSFVLKHLGFGSTNSLTPLRLSREIEAVGATYTVGVSREQIGYLSNVQRPYTRAVLEILSETARPKIREHELRFKKHAIEEDVVESERDPKTLLMELVHREAYRHTTLGQPLIAPLHNVEHINEAHVKEFVNSHFAPNRITVVAVGGVNHEELASGSEHLFNDSFQRHHLDIARTVVPEQFPNYYYREVAASQKVVRKAPHKAQAKFVGRSQFLLPGNFETHFAIAYEGVPLGHKDYFAAGVLQTLLGSGNAYSHEGPGAFLASRLNRNVVVKDSFVYEASAFNFNYTDSGLFGITAVAQPGKAGNLFQAITSELNGLKSNITDEEVNRAKALYKSHLLFGQQNRAAVVEFLATQSLVGENLHLASDFVRNIDSVTAADVSRVAKQILSSSPSIVAIGDVSGFPTHH